MSTHHAVTTSRYHLQEGFDIFDRPCWFIYDADLDSCWTDIPFLRLSLAQEMLREVREDLEGADPSSPRSL